MSRDIVQRVFLVLAREGWRVTLGPLIASAFTARDVTLDVFTIMLEVLYTHVRAQEELIRVREIRSATIAIRLLVPSDDQLLSFPYAQLAPADDRPQQYLRGIRRYHTNNLVSCLRELDRDIDGLRATVEIRRVPPCAYSKLYLFNGAEVVTGAYVPSKRPTTLDDGTILDVVDVMDSDSTLTYCAKDVDLDSQDSLIVSSWQRWFDSSWQLLAT